MVQFMYAMGENNSSVVNSSDGNHVGFRVGRRRTFDVALAKAQPKARSWHW